MRWGILLFVVLLAGCQAPSENTDEACSSPPEMVEAVDLDFTDSWSWIEVRVDSDVWSPHMLWVSVVDRGDEIYSVDGDSQFADFDGWATWSPATDGELRNGKWDVTVTDPEGCEGYGSFDVTGL